MVNSESPFRPVVLFAFADPHKDLPKLVDEEKEVAKLFLPLDASNSCNRELLNNANLDSLALYLNNHRDRIAIFHFAGHADQFNILLHSKEVGVEQGDAAKPMDVQGLAEILGTQEGLHLVFLNACYTGDHVGLLQENGIPVIIATAGAIGDECASKFATMFYEALISGATIRNAYVEATNRLIRDKSFESRYRDYKKDQFCLTSSSGEFLWGIYGNEEAQNWILPRWQPTQESVFEFWELLEEGPDIQDQELAIEKEIHLGRESELKEFLKSIQSTRDNNVVGCLIKGESGIGKTLLDSEGLRQLQETDREFLIVRIIGDLPVNAMPYSPIQQYLERLMREEPQRWESILEPLSPLQRILLLKWPGNGDIPLENNREDSYRILRYVISHRKKPTLLVVDDLQWVDAETVKFLCWLCDRPPKNGLALVLLQLDTEEPEAKGAIDDLLDLLKRKEAYTNVELQPFPEVQLDQFKDAFQRPDVPRDKLYEITDGIPYFVVEELKSKENTKNWTTKDGRLKTWLRPLSAESRNILNVASILGRNIRKSVLQGMVDKTENEVGEAIVELEKARLIKAEGLLDYRISPGLIRKAILEEMGTAYRAELHQKAARYFFLDYDGVDNYNLAAHHYWEAIRHIVKDLDRAVKSFVNAGYSTALSGQLEAGLRWFDRAMEISPKQSELLIYSLVTKARVLERYHKYEEASKVLEEAETMYPSGISKARVLNARGLLTYTWKGKPKEVQELAEEALKELENDPLGKASEINEVKAEALSNLGIALFAQGKYGESETKHREALEIRKRLKRPDWIAHSLNNLGLALMGLDKPEADSCFEQAAKHLKNLGHLTTLAIAYSNRGYFLDRQGEASEDRGKHQDAQQFHSLAKETFGHHTPGLVDNNYGMNQFYLGNYELARDCYLKALASADFIANERWRARVLSNLVEVEVFLGLLNESQAHLEVGLDLARKMDPGLVPFFLYYQAETQVLLGMVSDAKHTYQKCAECAREFGQRPLQSLALSRLARLTLNLGLAQEAQRINSSKAVERSIEFVMGNYEKAHSGFDEAKDRYELGRMCLDSSRIKEDKALLSRAEKLLLTSLPLEKPGAS